MTRAFVRVPVGVLSSDISDGAFRLFCVLVHRNFRNSKHQPSQAELAADIGATDRTVRRLTSELEDAGLLKIRRGRSGLSYAISDGPETGQNDPVRRPGQNDPEDPETPDKMIRSTPYIDKEYLKNNPPPKSAGASVGHVAPVESQDPNAVSTANRETTAPEKTGGSWRPPQTLDTAEGDLDQHELASIVAGLVHFLDTYQVLNWAGDVTAAHGGSIHADHLRAQVAATDKAKGRPGADESGPRIAAWRKAYLGILKHKLLAEGFDAKGTTADERDRQAAEDVRRMRAEMGWS